MDGDDLRRFSGVIRKERSRSTSRLVPGNNNKGMGSKITSWLKVDDLEKFRKRRGRSASLAGRLENSKGLQTQFRTVGGRKRQQTKNSGEDSQAGCQENSDNSKEEITPAWHKQKKAWSMPWKRSLPRRCDLGDSCFACNGPECGKCKFCLDK